MIIHNALYEHEKIFFILQQGLASGALKWENEKILIPITGELQNPYIDNKTLMHIRKFSNIILENIDNIIKSMNEISNSYFKKISYGEFYEIIKTNYEQNFKINCDRCFILLPQTNQCLYYDKYTNIDKDIFISHAYIMIIPIAGVAGIDPATSELTVRHSTI